VTGEISVGLAGVWAWWAGDCRRWLIPAQWAWPKRSNRRVLWLDAPFTATMLCGRWSISWVGLTVSLMTRRSQTLMSPKSSCVIRSVSALTATDISRSVYMLVHNCQPSSRDQPHHTNTNTPLQPHHTRVTLFNLQALYTHLFNGPFSGLSGRLVPERWNQSGFYWSKRQWVAVASAGPYASLHLAADR